jgi:hypothetical protein
MSPQDTHISGDSTDTLSALQNTSSVDWFTAGIIGAVVLVFLVGVWLYNRRDRRRTYSEIEVTLNDPPPTAEELRRSPRRRPKP